MALAQIWIAVLIAVVASMTAQEPAAVVASSCAQYQPDRAEWCSATAPILCNEPGAVGREVRGVCPSTCRDCLAEASALDAALQDGATVEYRTGMVIVEPSNPRSREQARLNGWDLWLERSGALGDGIPVGHGRVKVLHTTLFVPSNATCERFYAAARELIDVHKVQSVILPQENCNTNLSMTYHEAGVLHFLQAGNSMETADGQPYVNKHAWYPLLDSDEYPLQFLRKMVLEGATRVALVWWDGHPWASKSARTLMTRGIPSIRHAELVYSWGWPAATGGLTLSTGEAGEYGEAYDTDVWDSMLTEAAASKADVLIIYGMGEGVSVVRRLKVLQLSFSGVLITSAPNNPQWPQLLGSDGDFIVTPAQWHSTQDSPCFLFGNSSNYAREYAARFGSLPSYFSAGLTAAGLILQLAMQTYSSLSTDIMLAGLQTMSNDTMFGRVKFSYTQRNIGRSPLLLQRQERELVVTLPEELATSELAFFVDWRCRSFYTKPEIGVCTDAEFEVYLVCKEKYPGVDIQVCEQRSLQAQEAAQLALTLKMALPLAFASLCILLAVGVSVHKHYKSYLRNKGMTIDFLDLSYVSARSTGPSGSQDSASMIAGTTSFNVISGKAGSALKLARFRGSQVVLREWRKVTKADAKEPHDTLTARAQSANLGRLVNPVAAPQTRAVIRTARRSMGLNREQPIGHNKVAPSLEPIVHAEADVSTRSRESIINVVSTKSEELVSAPEASSLLERLCCGLVTGHTDYNWLPGNVTAAAELRHNNLVSMMGVTTDRATGNKYVVMECLALGSLRNILQDDHMSLRETAALLRIVQDTLSGISYLHGARQPFIHGDIRAKNILLDEKLTAKVRTDVRPIRLPKRGRIASEDMHTAWSAPELICGELPSVETDIYALGMTIWEIFSREDPFQDEGCTDPMHLPQRLRHEIVHNGVRPKLPSNMPPSVGNAVTQCWDKDPAVRPHLEEIIMAVIVAQEDLPQAPAEDELASSNDLLHQMLPPHVAAALREGRKVEPETFKSVTIFFSDIVGYTDISSSMLPQKVMDMLDRLYKQLDSLCVKHRLFKVETIGDAYMCVGGMTDVTRIDHALRVARFALDAVQAANAVWIDEDDKSLGCINIRAGFHSGSVIASVVGELNPRYCLFGDTVNTASRMESNSKKNMINLSPTASHLLRKQLMLDSGSHDTDEKIVLDSRGCLDIKGKGKMECFFLRRH